MPEEKNEIEKLIESMIESGDDLVKHIKPALPDSLAESIEMFHETNVMNLRKIKDFLNQ